MRTPRRYAALVVELPESYPTPGAGQQAFKIHLDPGPDAAYLLAGPVRDGLLRLRPVTGRPGEFFRHTMRVTMDR